jgi:F-type H+-transporting ATPase subunit a
VSHPANWVTEVSFLPPPFNVININTLIMTWAAMAVIMVLAFWLTRGIAVRPHGRQVVAEGVFGLCRSITMQTGGSRGDMFLFYIGSLFIFILTANLMGQLPLRLIQLSQGELIAATGDFNTTAALGVFTLVMYFYFGLKAKGLSYFSHYVKPFVFFLPVNLTEDVTRPFSLMLRLYANIMVGEILSSIALQMIPIGAPVLVILLELFVACLQAYIFAILSSAYIAILSDDHH